MKPGDRVTWSEYGRENFARSRNRYGTIRAISRDGSMAYLKWDGRKSEDRLALAYLAPIPESRRLAELIEATLFTNAAGQVADRLVLELPGKRDGGGWGRGAAANYIEEILADEGIR